MNSDGVVNITGWATESAPAINRNVMRAVDDADMQPDLFQPARRKSAYRPVITASENLKGVLDVDTVKGCELGMSAHPRGGCYGACYAAKTAALYKRDFRASVSRMPCRKAWREVWAKVKAFRASWYRIGTAGDPSHDWDTTLRVCELLASTGKQPVIITKHWLTLSDEQLERFKEVRAVLNTSVSALDSREELAHRLYQLGRISRHGMKSAARVVTCAFGNTEWGRERDIIQAELLKLSPIIDNPLRLSPKDQRVIDGHIVVSRVAGAVGGGKWVSLHSPDVYLGTCTRCPDQCGAEITHQ